jgi:NAD(P)-dependent dehydrogenase (short-subunit alcohol dehydrogenase family)
MRTDRSSHENIILSPWLSPGRTGCGDDRRAGSSSPGVTVCDMETTIDTDSRRAVGNGGSVRWQGGTGHRCAFGHREGQTPVAHSSIENFDRIMGVNLRGVFLCMKYEIRQMLEQSGGGAIVNTASTMGAVASPGCPAYVVSKHDVVGLTKSAAVAYGEQGIRVNAVCPGNTDTPILDAAKAGGAGVIEALVEGTPMRRLAEPMEIAKAMLWLCSDAASFCTGHAMLIDGGYVAR